MKDECINCGTCLENCPSGAIIKGKPYTRNRELCSDCGTCAEVCPICNEEFDDELPMRKFKFT